MSLCICRILNHLKTPGDLAKLTPFIVYYNTLKKIKLNFKRT